MTESKDVDYHALMSKRMSEPKDVEYHLRSIKCARVREILGGVAAVDSYMFENAIAHLLEAGLTPEEIVSQYAQKFGHIG